MNENVFSNIDLLSLSPEQNGIISKSIKTKKKKCTLEVAVTATREWIKYVKEKKIYLKQNKTNTNNANSKKSKSKKMKQYHRFKGSKSENVKIKLKIEYLENNIIRISCIDRIIFADIANSSYGNYKYFNIKQLLTDLLHLRNNLIKYDRHSLLSLVTNKYKPLAIIKFIQIKAIFKLFKLYKISYLIQKNKSYKQGIQRIAGDKVNNHCFVSSAALTEIIAFTSQSMRFYNNNDEDKENNNYHNRNHHNINNRNHRSFDNHFDLRVLKMMCYYHSKYSNLIKVTPLGTANFVQNAFKLSQTCMDVLSIIFTAQKQIKPAHLKAFKDILININLFKSNPFYQHLTLSEMGNQNFERVMVYVGNIVGKYLQCLDYDSTPQKILALFHFIAQNEVVVNNIIDIAKSMEKCELSEVKAQEQIFGEIDNALNRKKKTKRIRKKKKKKKQIIDDKYNLDEDIMKRAKFTMKYATKSSRHGRICISAVIPADYMCKCCNAATIVEGTRWCIDCQNPEARKEYKLIIFMYEFEGDRTSQLYIAKKHEFVTKWIKSLENGSCDFDTDYMDE